MPLDVMYNSFVHGNAHQRCLIAVRRSTAVAPHQQGIELKARSDMHHTYGLRGATHQPGEQHWGLIALGVLLIVLGLIAFGASVATTLVSVVLLGTLLIIAGVDIGVTALRAGSSGWVALRIVFAVLTVIAGILLIVRPLTASLALTLLIAWYFIFAGLAKAISALVDRPPNTGWEVASSVITFLLGLLLLIGWPITGLFAIGIFVAIDLMVFGIALLLGAFEIPAAGIDHPHPTTTA